MAAVGARPTENQSLLTATTMLRPYLENHGLAMQVVAELGLDKPPNAIRPDMALSRVFTVEELKGTSTLVLRARLPDGVGLQGNLDPVALVAGGSTLARAVDHILKATRQVPFIFNLGHGILPETPIEHVEELVRLVRSGL